MLYLFLPLDLIWYTLIVCCAIPVYVISIPYFFPHTWFNFVENQLFLQSKWTHSIFSFGLVPVYWENFLLVPKVDGGKLLPDLPSSLPRNDLSEKGIKTWSNPWVRKNLFRFWMSSRLMLFLRLLPPDAFLPVAARSVRLVRDENLRLLLLLLPGCSKLSFNFPLEEKEYYGI